MIIKAGNINNLTEARFFSSWNIDWIGFDLNPLSIHSISTRNAAAIAGWLSGPKILVECENRSHEEILIIIDQISPDGIQISFGMDSSTFAQKDVVIFKTMTVDQDSIPMGIGEDKHLDFLVLKSDIIPPLSKEDPLTQFIIETCEDHEVILDVPIRKENIWDFMEFFSPAGVNIRGTEEIATGLKDFEQISEILEVLRTRENQ